MPTGKASGQGGVKANGRTGRPCAGALSVTSLPDSLQLSVWKQAVALHQSLQRGLDEPVDLVITDNRRSLIRMSFRKNRHCVRLHHMFVHADSDVVSSLLTLASKPTRAARRDAKRLIRRYVEGHEEMIRGRPPKRRVRVRARGAVHDLAALGQDVICAHFQEDPNVTISWGRWGRPGRTLSTVRLGSYDARRELVRIHPILDQEAVPSWVVKFILYHELLHVLVPSRRSRGRTLHHGKEFKRLEKAHPDYDRYKTWVREDLPFLMRAPSQR